MAEIHVEMCEENRPFQLYYFCCPRCGSSERFVRVDGEGSGCLPMLLLLSGHLFFALLADWNSSRVVCGKCMHVFRKPSPPRSPAGVAFAAASFVFAVAGAALLLASQNNSGLLNRQEVVVTGLLEMLMEAPVSGLFLLGISSFAVAVIALLLSARYSILHRRGLRRRFSMEPEDPA